MGRIIVGPNGVKWNCELAGSRGSAAQVGDGGRAADDQLIVYECSSVDHPSAPPVMIAVPRTADLDDPQVQALVAPIAHS